MPVSPSPPPRRRSPFVEVLLFVVRAVFAVVITLDEIVRPIYRPLVRRVARLRVARLLEGWVGGLPPYLVLVLIGVPYVVVEPLKFLSLLWVAHGHPRTGTAAFLLANLVSFVLIERIFTAGRAQLMTLRPVAWLVDTAGRVRELVLARLGLGAVRRRLQVIGRWVRRHGR